MRILLTLLLLSGCHKQELVCPAGQERATHFQGAGKFAYDAEYCKVSQ